jgi:DNA-directed RNA polymerase alpha subunit
MIFFLFLKRAFGGYKMKETPITIYIHDLEISDKSKSFLGHVGLMRLNDLLNCDMMELSATRNISEDVLQELNGVIAHADDIICFFEERAKRIKEILPDVQDTPIESLRLGTRATNALRRGGIHTVGALIQMSQKDIFELRNVGVLSREEITKAIESIVQSGKIVYHEREEESKTIIETAPESSRLSEPLPEIESISLDDVPFSVRARNALKRANVQTAGELVQMSEKDIMSLQNVGAQTRDEILAVINAIIREGRTYFDISHLNTIKSMEMNLS